MILPRQSFHILPTTPLPKPCLESRSEDDSRALATIATIMVLIMVLIILVAVLCGRRLLYTNHAFGSRPAAREDQSRGQDVEASGGRDAVPVSAPARMQHFSVPSQNGGSLELPRTTEDLKKLGRETRESWGRADEVPGEGSGDIALETLSARKDKDDSRGRSLTGTGAVAH